MTEVLAGAESRSVGEGATGVLLLHGFTSNPSSMRPLAEKLSANGFAIEMPRLPGHGTNWRDLSRTGWRDWARESISGFEALRSRTRRQVVLGLSMGGTLGLHLAQTRGDDLAGLVLINPAVMTRDPRLKLLWLAKWVVPTMPGIGNDIAKPDQEEMAYSRVPLKALASMLELQRIVRDNLERVTVPTLVLTSRDDHVVSTDDSATIVRHATSTDMEQVWLERSYHVATLDHDADLVAERAIAFVQRVTT
jgi:carboxylesterase